MSISKIAVKICKWMDKINHNDSEENKVIQYGLELLLDNILKFSLIQLIGIFIGLGKETFVILFAFCGLRLQAGGKHAKTGIGCTLSMIMIWALSIFGDMFFEIKISFVPYIYIICVCIIAYCVPRTINIDYFTSKDKLKKKLYSLVFLSFLMIIAVLYPVLRGLIIYPVTIEVLTLLPKNKIEKRRKMKMKKESIMKFQKALTKISLNSVGRSIPIGVYERKIPTEVLKANQNNSKEISK